MFTVNTLQKTLRYYVLPLCALGGWWQHAAAETGDNILPSEKVVVYNWSEYIPEDVLTDFTEETNIQVEYSTYDNNEMLYSRLKIFKGRGYDVAIPSTYMVDRLASEGLIQPLQPEKLKNFKHIDPSLLGKTYDSNNKFSVPYLWGSTGIGVNTNKISAKKIARWSDLWNKGLKGQLFLVDDMMDIFRIALKVKGYSINTSDPEEIKQAYDMLHYLLPNIKLFGADIQGEFLDGNVDLGVVWNGDMLKAKEKKPNLQYIYPKEGANFWMDSFVITAKAQNVDNAHKFIDFMLRPEIAKRCVEELDYATANATGKALLDDAINENAAIFPPSYVLSSAEFPTHNAAAADLYQFYWKELRKIKP